MIAPGARVRRALGYAAALPVSAAAAAVAAALLVTGARVRAAGGVLEVFGGLLRPLLLESLPGFPIAAVTLGHVVFAADAQSLAASRAHERVHVAQYERWGFLFPVLYLAAGARAVLEGGNAYRDNVFEREAVRRAGEEAVA